MKPKDHKEKLRRLLSQKAKQHFHDLCLCLALPTSNEELICHNCMSRQNLVTLILHLPFWKTDDETFLHVSSKRKAGHT